jgi:hypothetical protein
MQVGQGAAATQIISGVAANRPDAAVRQDAAQPAPRDASRSVRAVQPVAAGSESAKPRNLPRGSLIDIVA